jgi:hypothetical protein
MENKFNLTIKSEIIDKQADYLFEKAYEKLGPDATDQAISAVVAETLQRYYRGLGRPLMIPRTAERDHLPFVEDYNETIEEMVEDISILFSEVENIGDYFAGYFNYAQSEKSRLQYRMKSLNGLTTDLNLIANDSYGNAVYFKESFDDTKNIEPSMIMGMTAQIATQEGIVTLARSGTVNRSEGATIKTLQGNGDNGTHHIARRTGSEAVAGQTVQDTAVYISDQIPNDDPISVLDGRPDTVFEYQMVNLNRNTILDVAKGYDFEWAKGAKDNDKLRLKLTIELASPQDINWININPYYAPYSTGKITVYSIRTSEDGFDYKSLYEDGKYILNAELNTTPQTYRADALFDGKNDFTASKFAGQGVWAFPTRKARYVEFVFDQVESYEELIGHTYYERVKKGTDGLGGETTSRVRIPASQVPKNVIEGKTGTYTVDNETQIDKKIETFVGWRYAIGIRDINIMSYQFEEKSEIVSKRYETTEDIKQIMLYSNEKIPQSYLNVVGTSNDWIQYFVSLDDVNWHRISPMHHQPVSKDGFPPKILELNGNKTDLESSFQLHKEYVETEGSTRGVRLKVVLSRPKDIPDAVSTTPILEDYALRVIFKDEHVGN